MEWRRERAGKRCRMWSANCASDQFRCFLMWMMPGYMGENCWAEYCRIKACTCAPLACPGAMCICWTGVVEVNSASAACASGVLNLRMMRLCSGVVDGAGAVACANENVELKKKKASSIRALARSRAWVFRWWGNLREKTLWPIESMDLPLAWVSFTAL